MKNDTISNLVFGFLTEELEQILSFREFPQFSENLQLPQAAQVLSKASLAVEDKWETPFNWDSQEWERLCEMDYIGRIAHSAAFMSIELKRVEKLKQDAEKEEAVDFEEELTVEDMGLVSPDEDLETPAFARSMYLRGAEEVKPIDEEMREASKRSK